MSAPTRELAAGVAVLLVLLSVARGDDPASVPPGAAGRATSQPAGAAAPAKDANAAGAIPWLVPPAGSSARPGDANATWMASPGLTPASAPSAPAGAAKTGASSSAEEPWEVKFKIYGWLPSLEGHAGRGRAVSDVNVSICDLLDNLDLLDCLVPVDLEARVGNWGFFTDLQYMKLEDEFRAGPLGGVNVRVKAQQTILEIGGFYRAGTWFFSPAGDMNLKLDLLGGARYNNLTGDIGIQHREHAISVGGSQEWWDPFVGPRLTWHAMDQLDFFARGDVGGFGFEHTSHFAWQFIGGADYYFCKSFFVELGYRLLDTHFSTGDGQDGFTYNVKQAGPYMALGLKF